MVRRLVIIRPLHRVVYAQPLITGSDATPAAERTGRVYGVGVAGHHVGRHHDVVERGDFGLPEIVHEGVLLRLGLKILPPVLPDEARRKLARERHVGYAAAHEQVTVDVAHAFPRRDCGKMRRLLRGGEPLRDREVGVAGEPDLSVAPGLRAEPLDQVVVVLALLLAPDPYVTLGVVGAARVRVADRVAVGAPVCRVGAFELHQAGQFVRVHAEQAEQLHVTRVVAAALAVRAPRHDRRYRLGRCGAEHVHVDGDAVAQLYRHVLVQNDVHRQRQEAVINLEAGLQRLRARFEAAEISLFGRLIERKGVNEHFATIDHERPSVLNRHPVSLRRHSRLSARVTCSPNDFVATSPGWHKSRTMPPKAGVR